MTELVEKIIDKLVSKDVAVTYTFDHLQIDVPQARGPDGNDLGGAKWVIDGKIIIATTPASSNQDQQSPNTNTNTTSHSTKYLDA